MKSLGCLLLAFLLSPGLAGCSDKEAVELFVDLRTDFVPVHEFAKVEVALGSEGSTSLLQQESTAVAGDSYIAGTRVAEYAGLAKGTYRVIVRLRANSGLLLAERPASVQVRSDRLVTIIVTRDCLGVSCDDPAASACLQAACVPESCTPETPETCPEPACQAASECSAPVAACAEATCEEGACLVRGVTPSVCAADMYCDPSEGCLPTDRVMDAGVDGALDGSTGGTRLFQSELALGASHTCALSSSGDPHCWGRNVEGELGDGTNSSRPVPEPVADLDNIIHLSSGARHVCALRSGSSVPLCWGRNSDGQLGNGALVDENRPVPASISGIDRLFLGAEHSCALGSAGLWCWGRNGAGRLGTGSSEVFVPDPAMVVGITTALDVAASSFHTCAVVTEDLVQCWGSNNSCSRLGDGTATDSNTPVTVVGLTGAARIAAGVRHTCVLLRNGSVSCWGCNTEGQLATGDLLERTAPTPVAGLPRATDLSAGLNHACALSEDGSVWCWGDNFSGQLGNGTTENQLTPVRVADLVAVTVRAGTGHTCAERDDGRIVCWGLNDRGQLGDGTTENRLTPVEAALP